MEATNNEAGEELDVHLPSMPDQHVCLMEYLST
jgi:hypothetical protein